MLRPPATTQQRRRSSSTMVQKSKSWYNDASVFCAWGGPAACRATRRDRTGVGREKERPGWPSVEPSTTSASHTQQNVPMFPNQEATDTRNHGCQGGSSVRTAHARAAEGPRVRQGAHQRAAPWARGGTQPCSHVGPVIGQFYINWHGPLNSS